MLGDVYARRGEHRVFFDVEGTHTGWRDGKLVERPVVLVVHGGPGFPHVYFRPWLSGLAARYCLVYVDLRGSGWSSRHPGSGYPIEAFAEDVSLVRETLGLECVVLLGHSFGGPVVLESTLAEPEHVDALILACSIHSFAPLREPREPPLLDESLLAEMSDLMARGAELYASDPARLSELDEEPIWGRIVAGQFEGPVPELWQVAVASMRLGIESYFCNTGAAVVDPDGSQLGHWDIRPRLAEITVPTLVLGADSPAEWAAPVDVHSRQFAELLPDAELHLVPGVGHYFFAERHATFCEPIVEFLERRGFPGAETDAGLLARHHGT
jgi:proline iminopeptidase